MKKFLLLLMAVVALGACSQDAEPTVSSTSTTLPPTTTTTTVEPICGDEFPVFLTFAGEQAALGAVGVGRLGRPLQEGQVARHWDLNGTYVDIRWPAATGVEAPGRVSVSNQLLAAQQRDFGVTLTVDIGGESDCRLLEADVHGAPDVPAAQQVANTLAESLVPVADLEAFFNPPPPDPVIEPVDGPARLVAQFLEAAGSGQWDQAARLLSPQALAGLPEGASPAEQLEEYCGDALCAAAYEISGFGRTGDIVSTVDVDLDGGAVGWQAAIHREQERLLLDGLPPEGSAPARPPLSERLFGDPGVAVGAVWYDAVSFGEGSWIDFPEAVGEGVDIEEGRWGIAHGVGEGGDRSVFVRDLLGEFEPEEFPLSSDFEWVGAGVFGERPVAYVGEGSLLWDLDVSTLDLEPLLSLDPSSGVVNSVDAAGDTLAITIRIGDSVEVQFFDLGFDQLSEAWRDGSYVNADLDTAGEVAAVVVVREVTGQNDIALIPVGFGIEVAAWPLEGEGSIVDVQYNGQFVIGQVEHPDQPPATMVVDTFTGSATVVPVVAQLRF